VLEGALDHRRAILSGPNADEKPASPHRRTTPRVLGASRMSGTVHHRHRQDHGRDALKRGAPHAVRTEPSTSPAISGTSASQNGRACISSKVHHASSCAVTARGVPPRSRAAYSTSSTSRSG